MRLSLFLATALALAVPAYAQESRSIFSVLDTEGRTVGPASERAQGTLSDADVLSTEGRRLQVWTLDVAPGDELQMDLRSPDFDSYLYVVGPGLGVGLTDDDSGSGLDSRLCLSVGEAGEYRLVASSLNGETGDFTLEVTRRPGATSGACPEEGEAEVPEVSEIAELPTGSRTLSVGDDIEGSLGPSDPMLFGSHAQAWAVAGRTGASFSVDLTSDDFDAYLLLDGPGLDVSLSDDDGAGRCDSRISLEFPEDGSYRLVVSTLGEGEGQFRLVASEAPGPVDSTSCLASRSTSPEVTTSTDDVATVGSLQPGRDHAGTMGDADGEFDGRHLQGWTLEGQAGARLAIDVVSEDFDSYLYLTGPGFPEPVSDDDSAGDLDSRICVELPETATYRFLAGPLSGAHEGEAYTLRVRTADLDALCDTYTLSPAAQASRLAALPTEGRSIAVGQEREGLMDLAEARHPDSNRLIQAWSAELTAGREVTVDVVSDVFDPVLYVLGPGIGEPLYADDAGGGICNSRLEFTPSESGTFTLLPGSYYEQAAGAFRLRVSTDPPPLEEGGCVGSDAGSASTGGTSSADSGALAGVSTGDARRLEVGTEVEGSLGPDDEVLESGEPAQAWTVEVAAGDQIVFELLSEDFDCILFVDDGGPAAPLRDDDGAGNLDSRVVYTATEDRVVRVVVSALSAGNSGTFQLRAIRRAR